MSTHSLWSQRSAQETPPPHAACGRCSQERFLVESLPRATTWNERSEMHQWTSSILHCHFQGKVVLEKTTHKPVAAHFYPQNVLVVGFLSRSTVVTEPAALGHVNVQTLTVKGSRARFTAEQTSSYRERQKTNVILINNCSKMFALSSRLTLTVFSNLENNSLSKHQ